MILYLRNCFRRNGRELWSSGHVLRRLRLKLELMQSDLDSIVSMQPKSISSLEMGRREPSIDALLKLAHAPEMPRENYWSSSGGGYVASVSATRKRSINIHGRSELGVELAGRKLK
ncbi:helix-turn-helix domain-containing protein [Duganella sp. FT80W]|uniref:Helix-turn-helix domain-containing protein n=1 Tax=Duganella guangzhouensis TaxID=2666084 RepID=A0A6I2KSU9_9BURK|nr:helix-turn-helix domain-containing protein [Duganella guangzhouensis]